ncbi:MAG: hypothetical protein ACE5FT_00275 [Candidatus Nanoarchaeia archaeon]
MRGQVTTYIIIGIIALLFIGFLVSQTPAPTYAPQDIAPVITGFTQECLRNIGTDAIQNVGLQGGYAYKSEVPGYVSVGSFPVHYSFYEGENLLPSREFIGRQISLYVDDFLNTCLDNYKVVNESTPGTIKMGLPKTTAEIGDRNVQFVLELPVEVVIQQERILVDKFQARVNVPLGSMLNTGDTAITILQETPGMVDLVAFSRLGYEAQFTPMDRKGVVTLTSETKLNDRPFSLLLGVNFGDNTPPQISVFPIVRIKLGEHVDIYAQGIDLEGDEITWLDDSEEFDIDPSSGRINFVTQARGEYTYTIYAADETLITEKDLKVIVI